MATINIGLSGIDILCGLVSCFELERCCPNTADRIEIFILRKDLTLMFFRYLA